MSSVCKIGPMVVAALTLAVPDAAWGKPKEDTSDREGGGTPTALPAGGGPARPSIQTNKDNRVTPPKKKRKDRIAEREAKDFSEGGTRRGAIEFTLGGAAVAVFGVLVGRGAWEVVQGQELDRDCANGTSMELQCETTNPPSRGNRVAAGLSFGFAVPMAIAAGFLFAHGARIHRDYKAWKVEQQRVQLIPSASRRGVGLGLQVRF